MVWMNNSIVFTLHNQQVALYYPERSMFKRLGCHFFCSVVHIVA